MTKMKPRAHFGLFLSLCIVFVSYSSSNSICDDLNEEFSTWTFHNYLSSTVRVVSTQENTHDTPDCLCRRTLCSSIEYALFGENNETEYLSNITVVLESGVHNLTNGILIDSASHISFVGVEGAVMQCGHSPNTSNMATCSVPNISIRNSSSIYFYGITFKDCGLNQFANVFVQYSNDVVFHNCTFRNSLSSAVHLLNTTSAAFLSCSFDSNIQGSNEGTSALLESCHADRNSVFFLDSRPTAGGISVYANNEPLKLLISETRFVNNSARPNEDNTAARTVLSFGHGGGIFIRLVGTSDSQVCIRNSEFTENSAEVNGGAIQLSAADYSSNNSILIENCTFTNNKCLLNFCTGGAIGIDYFEESHDNLVHVMNSSFFDNSAATGGAVALLTSVGTNPNENEGKPLWFKDCLFEHNNAHQDGTVLSLYSVTLTNELGFPVFVENCRFRDNIALDVNKLTAAMSVFRVTVTFQQTNVFHNNFGGGLTLTESRANIDGSVAFHHNFAYNGGGVAMYGRCLVEMYKDSELTFHNNYALKRGGGMYVEYVSADFIFSILNRGCFFQYFSESDTPPNQWESIIHFANNTAGESGAAIYASDMSRCLWYGPDYSNNENQPIFVPVEGYDSPFMFRDNIVANDDLSDEARQVPLATDAVRMVVTPQFEAGNVSYSYSETVRFYLSTYDQFKNFREALWQVAALGQEELGALSVNNSVYQYEVPEVGPITNFTNDVNDSKISLYFTVNNVAADVETVNIELPISQCHPGYTFDNEACICDTSLREIVRCDNQHRYFYVQEGLWVGSHSDGLSLLFQPAIPGFLNCESEGDLPGCLYRYDDEDAQCAEGREGVLCSKCKKGYGLSFDLLSCHSDCSSWGGILAFLVFCILVVVLSFLALYFDIRISNKLKSLIFFGQVIKVIFRNSPYLSSDNSARGRLLNFFVNLPGTSLPFPICFHSDVSGYAIAWLGIVPPTLALGTALIYVKLAERSNILQKGRKSKSYGLHGLHLIILFIYKYFLDAAFTFIDVRNVDGQDIFSYSGESGTSVIAVLTFVIGIILVTLLAVVAPVLTLIYIYRPLGRRHFVDALTRGLKEDKRYLWYSVWDIWRRLPFIAVNLLITVTSVSVIVFCQLLLALFVMSVHCIMKPYIRNFINIVETFILFCLFGATLAILDDNDIYIQRQIAITFILLPFAYGLLYAVYLSIKLSFRKVLKKEFDLGKYFKKLQSAVKEKLSLDPSGSETSSQVQEPDHRGDSTGNEDQIRRDKRSSDLGESSKWNSSFPVQTREPLLDDEYVIVKQK